jgi:hypothetical protein
VLAIAWAGCSQPTDAQPYTGACDPFAPLSWDPAPNAEDVPRDAPIRVVFGDYPDPDTLGAADLLLWTGVYWHTGTYSVDLLHKTVVFRPANLLRADLGYTVQVLSQLHSLSGCPAEAQTRTFRTGETMLNAPAPDPVPFATVQPILAQRCAGGACHRATEDAGGGCLPSPAAGLSLCDDDAWDALVGVPSSQVSRLALVAAGDSARSYLVRKLLPGPSAGGAAPTTLGEREPPGSPLDDDSIAAITAWIDAGASR